MFETAALGHRITKKEFRAGVDGASKGSMVNVLANWMDPDYILTRPP